MRRCAALLLLLLTALLPLQPVLAQTQVEATLLACCRRNGKHHCMMQRSIKIAMGLAVPTGLAWTPPPCPWRPAVTRPAVATAVLTFQLAAHTILVARVIPSAMVSCFHVRARTQSTRAPPAVLL